MTRRDMALDEAARAGWLYYVAGNTQDQIAAKLGVSRQRAQRLVSRAVSEGLVKTRIHHPIGACMQIAEQLAERFRLQHAEVAPTDESAPGSLIGVAEVAAANMEYWLNRSEPLTIGLGTGRTLKAAIEQLSLIECPQHRLVSLTGNIRKDGSAAFYNIIFTLNDMLRCTAYPMPLPVVAVSAEEREMFLAQETIARTMKLAAECDVVFVGIGEVDENAPLLVDGFIDMAELNALKKLGAVGEITGWVFDRSGTILDAPLNDRVSSSPIPDREHCLVIAVAKGDRKVDALHAAMRGGLVNGLITDEMTARALLAK